MEQNFQTMTDLMNFIKLKIECTAYCKLNSTWNFTHNAGFNRIYYVLSGGGRIQNKNEYMELVPDHIYIIPAGTEYSFSCSDFLEKIYIHFSLYIIPGKDLMKNVKKISVFPVEQTANNGLKDMFFNADLKSAFICQSQMRNMLLSILNIYDKQIVSDIELYNKYDRVYQYINDNLYADTSVSQICSYAGFSQTYLGQKFKSDTGQTIKTYLTISLIEKIKYMLQCTRMSISEISETLHFSSEFYFSHFFKKSAGITPSEYRKKHKEY